MLQTRRGVSIIFISHKLNEVLDIADRITVLRRGKMIETLPRRARPSRSSRGSWWVARFSCGSTRAPADARRDATRRRGPPRARRPRSRGRSGVSFTVHAGEIVGDRRGRRERPDPADRSYDRAARGRAGASRSRSRPDRVVDAQDLRLRGRPHPGGPAAARARTRVRPRRELRAARLRPAAELPVRLAPTGQAGRARSEAGQGVRRQGRWSADRRRIALGREPAEGRRRARGRPRPARPDRGAADARPRRRRDRVRPPSSRGGARRGPRGPARLARARRDPLAVRPDPRHVRGSDRRRVRADVAEEELGFAMLGGTTEEAAA